MDKRRAWREQEQQLVERWNAAALRHRQAQEEMARQASAGNGASAELMLKAEHARAELEALRRKVARLKVEFNSGKRY